MLRPMPPGAALRSDREFLEQVAFSAALKLATVSFCIAVLGAVASPAALAAGSKACGAVALAVGQVAKKYDVGEKKQ